MICESKKGSVMVFVVLLMLFLSVMIISILTMMLCRYQSIYNTINYQQSFFLALGGREEALAYLNQYWSDTDSPWFSLEDGQYQYKIMSIKENKKKIISRGKNYNLERKLETIIQRTVSEIDFLKLKQVALYCEGDLYINDLDKIQSKVGNPNIIVRGNLTANEIKEGKVNMDVLGEMSIKNVSKDNFFKHCTLMDYKMDNYHMESATLYCKWIKEHYLADYIELSQNSGEVVLSQKDFKPDKRIYHISNMKQLTLQNLKYDGILIIEDIEKVIISENAQIQGMVLFVGNQINQLNMGGVVKGNILLFNMDEVDIKFYGEIKYDPEILQYLSAFLPDNLRVNNSTKRSINVIKWNEIE